MSYGSPKLNVHTLSISNISYFFEGPLTYWNVDFQRLNYLVSNEKSIEEIKNNISFRKDNFQHQAYKKGCISLDGTPTAKVNLQTKREYEKMLNINIGKIFKNEYQP